MALAYFNQNLKDPASARVGHVPVERGWYRPGDWLTRDSQPEKFAWVLDVLCNAKNSYGGYAGDQIYSFYFIGDQLVAVSSPKVRQVRYEVFTIHETDEIAGGGRTAEQAGVAPKK